MARSWSWAKEDGAIKNSRNVGKSRKLRKKGLAAATQEQQRDWTALGSSLCALAGAESCASGMSVFETSLKESSNKTVEVMKKEDG